MLRNFTLHDQTGGYLQLQDRWQVLEEIVWLVDEDPANIPQDSRFLLEVDFSFLFRLSFACQSYWLMAMEAKQCAGRRATVYQSCCGASACCLDLQRQVSPPTVNTEVVVRQIYEDTVQVSRTTRQRSHHASIEVALSLNKRLKKSD